MIRSILAIGAAVIALTGFAMGDVHASTPIVVGPGTTIYSDPLPCTIAAAGHDDAGNPVALTAGHCDLGQPEVFNAFGQHIGRFTVRSDSWGDISDDWAIIALDPGVQLSTVTPDGAAITSLGTNPAVGSAVTKFGQTTRTTTGTVSSLADNVIHATAFAFNGDSGGPAYQGGALVGLVSAMNTATFPTGTLFSGIDGILADLSRHGGFHLE